MLDKEINPDEKLAKILEPELLSVNKIIHGIVQVEDFEMYPILEEENSPKVDFIGKLISDHPSIHCTLKERTVSGPTQEFNFKEE